MATNKIKLILVHYYKRRDIYGNTYWKSKITNTRTGKSVMIDTPHRSNTESLCRKAGYEWEDMFSCPDVEIAARDWKYKVADIYNSCMDDAVIKAIKALNRKGQPHETC